MKIQIENPSQLNMVKDFAKFIEAHNKGVEEEKTKTESVSDDLLILQANLINTMSKILTAKQKQINALKSEIDDLKAEIKELELEIRVSKDLLTIAGAVKSGNSEENH